MSTFRTFNSMLNEYLAYDLLMEEVTRRSYVLDKVTKDNSWKSGPLVVPFEGAMASSYRYGKLTAENDIAEYEFVRGTVTGYKEIWGTMFWHSRDLIEHDGKVSEASFLKNLPQQIERFTEGMKDVVSVNLLSGSHFAKATADGTAGGLLEVDRPERFTLGQKVTVDDDDSAAITGYVKDININTRVIHLVTTRGGVVDVDLSPYTVAQNAKCYVDGADGAGAAFTSLRDQLLTSANGGSANLFGVSKLAYPYLQSLNISGATWGAATLLDNIFDAWTYAKTIGKCSAREVLCSYKHLGNVMKALEGPGGAPNQFKNVETKINVYGFTEITISGVKGSLKLVGVHEMDDDIMYLIDWDCVKLHSNGFFRKQTSPEGLQYYTVRTEDGYKYITDISFFGELVVSKPTGCAIVYGINY